MIDMALRIERAVALEADSDAFYTKACEFGSLAASALKAEKRSQITGLESIANSTRKVSDVLDYLKLRTARQKEWQVDQLGQELITYIEQTLKTRRNALCEEIERSSDASSTRLDPYHRQEVYVRLVQVFVAQIAAQYEFDTRLVGGRS